MTEEEFQRVQPVISAAQRIHTSAHHKLCAKGVLPIDSIIASMYAAHFMAWVQHSDPYAAIKWMRTALDTIERQMLENRDHSTSKPIQ